MAQVLIRQYSMDPLVHALASNPRRRPLIREGCASGGEVGCKISEVWHCWRRAGQFGHVPDRRAQEREFYASQCIVYTAQEGNDRRGGFAVLQGELIGLHHVDKGHGDWLMRAAVDAGAWRLNCFADPHLLSLYNRHGFNTVQVERNTNPTGPDVHYMERNV